MQINFYPSVNPKIPVEATTTAFGSKFEFGPFEIRLLLFSQFEPLPSVQLQANESFSKNVVLTKRE